LDNGVAVVTASTLASVLRVTANLWGLWRQDRSTKDLVELAGGVMDRVRILVGKMDDLDGSLKTALNHCIGVMTTLKGQGGLVRTAKKFEELGIKVDKKLLSLADESAHDGGTGDVDGAEGE
jgi:DNA anti-recombination protein RmuC